MVAKDHDSDDSTFIPSRCRIVALPHCRIFADADAIARRKVRRRAIILGGECSRDDVAGNSFADALPQKRSARPPGADVGGVGAFCASELPACQDPEYTIFAASSPTPTPSRAVKFGDAPSY